MSKKSIMWFRQDLRLADNPALNQAVTSGDVLCVYILEPHDRRGGASRLWLHHALQSLDKSLDGNLHCFEGHGEKILPDLCRRHAIEQVCFNRRYDPKGLKADEAVRQKLKSDKIEVSDFQASLLWEPWETRKKDGRPYKVFTPFYQKGCLERSTPRPPVSTDVPKKFVKIQKGACAVSDLNLLAPQSHWQEKLLTHWTVSEEGAHERLSEFINGGLSNYSEGRDFPAKTNASRLSPYLHFGLISPHAAWHAAEACRSSYPSDVKRFQTELGWREFSYCLLYHNPAMDREPLQTKFSNFPWNDNPDALQKWQKGETGCPIVDAGMRELWQTGYMHNRVRMIVASYLVKNLKIHWHEGLAWFHDCLFDADPANNAASWQWVSGSGADAAPYFRIFNPVTQGKKFDSAGEYVRTYVPELSDLPDKHLHAPFEAPKAVLEDAGICLGRDYPLPLVDLKESREAALKAFSELA